MRYQTVNNLLGWIVFLIALAVYTLTLEPSVSMWDCGEFIAAADKLQVVHQPGAPFFLMMGRLFSMFSPDEAGVSVAVNFMSALCSALTVLFTFWITTYLAKRIAGSDTPGSRIAIFASGTVAGLALTFSDTFWFSAVEAEVYAMSSFFTALTFWAAFKWEASTGQYAGKWLVLIAYLVGLSIGTHLLSLLVVPSLAFIYYFKNFTYSRKGLFYSFLVGFAALMFIQKIIIPGIPKLMSSLDFFFVNSLGFGFWSGGLFAVILLGGLVGYGIYYFSKVKVRQHWQIAFICLAYILLGYSSYAMVVIRSNEALPIDMSNPEEPFNLTDYINRAQYEERPLVYGPYFNAKPIDIKVTGTIYRKDSTQYTEVGEKKDYVYDPTYNTAFPRMSDMQKESSPAGYRYWGGMDDVSAEINQLENQVQQTQDPKQRQELTETLNGLKDQKPGMGNNLRFFFDYQMNHMYFRYFMWNFAGRQNDKQGHSYNRYSDGNWISGIPFLDNMRLGPQDGQPEHIKNNMGRNAFFFLPLILGILGLVIQYKKSKKDIIITGILFLFTGVLINVFLNQPPFEPRERDYVHVGSFQVFCIWIGLGVLWIFDRLGRKMSMTNAAILAAVVSLLAPVLMAKDGWDDHDRSKRYLAMDFARNYLESCPKNAILFANADNDTYPLWYAQNVEKVRRDVRIINQNLLPTDWYSQVLLTKIYDSEPLPLTLTREQLAKGVNDYYQFQGTPESAQPVDLRTFIKNQTATKNETFSSRIFTVPLNRAAAIKAGFIKADDSTLGATLTVNFPARGMHKGDLVLLDLIATNAERGWIRPICFSTIAGNEGFINLEPYFEQRGLIYQLTPVKTELNRGQITRISEDSYDLMMKTFRFSGMKEKPKFYLDDKAEVVASSMQELALTMATDYLQKAEEIKFYDTTLTNPENKRKYDDNRLKAKALLDKCVLEIPESVYHASGNIKFSMAAVRQGIGEDETSKKLLRSILSDSREVIGYYSRFKGRGQNSDVMRSRVYESFELVKRCAEYSERWGYKDIKAEMDKAVKELDPVVNMYLSEM